MSDEVRSSVDPWRGWGWVIGGGTAAGLLATFPSLGAGVWQLIRWVGVLVMWVWRLPYAWLLIGGLTVLVVVGVMYRMWRG